jgi:GntR family transcriptional regulator
VERIKGRGTFVAQPKLDARAGGLSRLLVRRCAPDVVIRALDVRVPRVEPSIRSELEANDDEDILRITSLLSVRGIPLSISYSFFRRDEVRWLEDAVRPGRTVPGGLVLSDHNVELAGSRIAIETSQCGQFEADRFGIPHRASVFLVLCTELRREGDGTRPFEVARVEYRGDMVQFRLEAAPQGTGDLEAIWEITRGSPPPARGTPARP